MTLDLICEVFSVDPDRAMELDGERVYRVLQSRAARQALRAHNDTTRPMSTAEGEAWGHLLDALDERNERLGIAPEAD